MPAAVADAPPEEATVDSATKKKVLIIEDERPLAHALELKLGHDGFETKTASDGVEGLKEAQTGKYDLILLDLILPEMDGFALLKELNKKKKTKSKVVILSNLGQEEDKQRIEEYGVAKYCVKSNMPLAAVVNIVKELTS